MASHPMPHSFAKVADERGRHSTSPLTQHEKLRRYEFGLEGARTAEPGLLDLCRWLLVGGGFRQV